MASSWTNPFGPLLVAFIALLIFARPANAFGAGNIAGISSVEGQNWRHGDIEDTLLNILMARAVGGKKFNKLMVSRVYFGNWLRDYSQAIDVGTVKSVSAEAIRLLLSVLGFMTFGFGSREFEVTAERLGCYRPEDHIDNPKNYADNQDARQYDRRLRGPIDESVELAIDPETGMKNYIANEGANIMTSALHVRRLFAKCIQLGRSFQRTHNKAELYEALRLMGTGLHCLEDFLAHSNYIELALIEMGERDVFPHVGRNTVIRLRGARHSVYPVVTGTFGGVDFLHSVTGEVSDKLTQNEIQELEGTLQNSQQSDTSVLKELLGMIPSGLFGGENKKQKLDDIQSNAQAAQMANMQISPRDPEAFTRQISDIFRQIMPAIEFHDELIVSITEAVEKIPVLPKIIEQLEEQLSVFVFSVIAPFVVPVIGQIKNELSTGSEEIIQSSKNEQLIVFDNDHSSDPTHSMLSKDHFSNVLNEIAGRTASQVVGWVVPQLMQAWDDHTMDVDRLLNRIVHGVMHHPAQRDLGEDGARDGRSIMFRSVEQWWGGMEDWQKDEYRRKLSRDGVLRGENHKEGVHDTGHGCGKPLHMHKTYAGGGGGGTMEDRIANQAAGAIMGAFTGELAGFIQNESGIKIPRMDGRPQQQTSFGGGGDGREGGLGGLLSSVAGSLLGGGGGGRRAEEEQIQSWQSSGRDASGSSYNRTTTTEYDRQEGGRYGQSEYSDTTYADGRERHEYSRYEQRDQGGWGGGTSGQEYREVTERRPQPGYGGGSGGYEERVEREWDDSRGGHHQEEETRRYGGGGDWEEEPRRHHSHHSHSRSGSRERVDREARRENEFGREEEPHKHHHHHRREDDGEERQEVSAGSSFGGFLGDMARRAEKAFEESERQW